jgi:hypothetical protein
VCDPLEFFSVIPSLTVATVRYVTTLKAAAAKADVLVAAAHARNQPAAKRSNADAASKGNEKSKSKGKSKPPAPTTPTRTPAPTSSTADQEVEERMPANRTAALQTINVSQPHKAKTVAKVPRVYGAQSNIGIRPIVINGPSGTVRVVRQKSTLEDAIGSHACSLEALACV